MGRRLRNCPHCGAPAKLWTRVSFDRRVNKETKRSTVLCTSCGCRTVAYARPEDAIDAWNRRYDPRGRRRSWWRRLLGVFHV